MKWVLIAVAVLAALATMVQLPEFLHLFSPETPQNLFTTIRQRVLMHDIGIAFVVALAAGFGAAVLHRMETREEPATGAPPAARKMDRQRLCPLCSAPVGAHETKCWKCGQPLGRPAPAEPPSAVRRRCPECATMVPLDRPKCWNCGHTFATASTPLSRLMPLPAAPQPAAETAAAGTATDTHCANCGRRRDAGARFCAGCGTRLEPASG
jgi:hypothetical protein